MQINSPAELELMLAEQQPEMTAECPCCGKPVGVNRDLAYNNGREQITGVGP